MRSEMRATKSRFSSRPVRKVAKPRPVATVRVAAAQTLKGHELKFRAVASQAPVGIFLSNLEGDAIYVNDTWCEMAGLKPKDALGKGWLAAIHPEDRARVVSNWKTAVNHHEPSQAEFRFLRRDGTVTWIQGRAVQLRDDEGRFSGYIGTIVDITERKKNESALCEYRERLQMAMEAAQMFSWEMDMVAEHVEWSANVERALGFTLPRKLSELKEFFHPDDRDQAATYLLQEKRGNSEPSQMELRLVNPVGGELVWIRTQGVVVSNSEGTKRFVGIAQNVTEQKQREQELRRSEQLRRAISKSVQHELQRARDEALAASRAKDEFLAALSHELRTPLNPVLLLASEAAEDVQFSAAVRAQFATIRDNVELEARLIDDLLDLTRITRGKLALEMGVVDVHVILRDALSTVQMEVDGKRLAVILELSARKHSVRGDAVRLRQVFWNVIKNAVRFTPEKGTIALRSNLSEDGENVVITITDTGMGMTPEELARVFHAFAQGEHADHPERGGHNFGGLGLGLAISRKLVEMHEGEINAESKGREEGSTFTISLPVTEKVAGPKERFGNGGEPAGESSSGLPRGIRVLLVEDHEPTRRALAQLLTRRQYQVETAGSLTEARALAKEHKFELLISDIGLPDGDGYALMMELGQEQHLKGIALTGYGMEHDVAFSQSAGFIAHLTKPVRVESLDSALAAAAKAHD